MASTVDKFQAIWLKILSSSNVLVQSLVFFCVSSSFIFLWRLFQSVLINDYITSNFQDLHMTYLASSNWSQWLLTGSNFLYIFITKTRTKSKKDFWTEEQQFVWNFIQSFFFFIVNKNSISTVEQLLWVYYLMKMKGHLLCTS